MAALKGAKNAAKPSVGIIMGSQSDWNTMRNAAETLDRLQVPYEARIVSAHRTRRGSMPMPRMHGRAASR